MNSLKECAKVKVNSNNPYTFFITRDHLHYRYVKAQLNIEIYTGKEWISAKQCELIQDQITEEINPSQVIHENSYPQGIYY